MHHAWRVRPKNQHRESTGSGAAGADNRRRLLGFNFHSHSRVLLRCSFTPFNSQKHRMIHPTGGISGARRRRPAARCLHGFAMSRPERGCYGKRSVTGLCAQRSGNTARRCSRCQKVRYRPSPDGGADVGRSRATPAGTTDGSFRVGRERGSSPTTRSQQGGRARRSDCHAAAERRARHLRRDGGGGTTTLVIDPVTRSRCATSSRAPARASLRGGRRRGEVWRQLRGDDLGPTRSANGRQERGGLGARTQCFEDRGLGERSKSRPRRSRAMGPVRPRGRASIPRPESLRDEDACRGLLPLRPRAQGISTRAGACRCSPSKTPTLRTRTVQKSEQSCPSLGDSENPDRRRPRTTGSSL